ncbi:MAG: hypothetical protein GBAus27B_000307 [Mycoplasmataceae bacterium]|nr:MAG: hypothetical protein GBAus27B_000307 [Mycoplasmataceae bacterium]
MILAEEKISPFKETVILYTLSGAMVLIGLSWGLMFLDTYKSKKTNH